MLNYFTVEDINSVEPLSTQALPPNPLFGPSRIKLTSKKYLESKSDDIHDGWLTVLEICLTPPINMKLGLKPDRWKTTS
jgi:hypothetical protein